MEVSSIARMTNHSEEEAQRLYDIYFEKLPKLSQLISSCNNKIETEGFIKTLFGRLRKFNLEGLPPKIKEREIKKGFNTLIQGTAADLLKIALLRIKKMVLDVYGPDVVRLILTVHDETDFYVRTDMLEEVMGKIKYAMEIPTPPEWCRLVADLEYGPSWSESTHVDWKPSAEEYSQEEWSGWGKVLPADYSSFLEDPEYIAKW